MNVMRVIMGSMAIISSKRATTYVTVAVTVVPGRSLGRIALFLLGSQQPAAFSHLVLLTAQLSPQFTAPPLHTNTAMLVLVVTTRVIVVNADQNKFSIGTEGACLPAADQSLKLYDDERRRTTSACCFFSSTAAYSIAAG